MLEGSVGIMTAGKGRLLLFGFCLFVSEWM